MTLTMLHHPLSPALRSNFQRLLIVLVLRSYGRLVGDFGMRGTHYVRSALVLEHDILGSFVSSHERPLIVIRERIEIRLTFLYFAKIRLRLVYVFMISKPLLSTQSFDGRSLSRGLKV